MSYIYEQNKKYPTVDIHNFPSDQDKLFFKHQTKTYMASPEKALLNLTPKPVPNKGQIGDLIKFDNYEEFTPNVTPDEMFDLGVFGGTYWRPIYSNTTKKHLKDEHLEFSWPESVPESKLTSVRCDPHLNYYGVTAGSSLEQWEDKKWINEIDPYGWVQWYCRFYSGRRSDDDKRQIQRWVQYAGPKGRWKRNLDNQIIKKGSNGASKVVRQGLLQWAYIN
jgi:hypothetical protein